MSKQLIAMAVIAAGTFNGQEGDILEGVSFLAPPDVADALVAEGKAKLADEIGDAPAAQSQDTKARGKGATVKARVLASCSLGKPDDVVELSASEAKLLQQDGLVDTDKAAVAFAAELPQNQPKK